jgi:nitrile hydratase accessory protein
MAERGTPAATLALEDGIAPPRRNGELVFAAPWESRVFAMAVALHERGLFEWDDFRERLIAAIAASERAAAEWSYYACWQSALESLLDERGLCPESELDLREKSLAARPEGHDHTHRAPRPGGSR